MYTCVIHVFLSRWKTNMKPILNYFAFQSENSYQHKQIKNTKQLFQISFEHSVVEQHQTWRIAISWYFIHLVQSIDDDFSSMQSSSMQICDSVFVKLLSKQEPHCLLLMEASNADENLNVTHLSYLS